MDWLNHGRLIQILKSKNRKPFFVSETIVHLNYTKVSLPLLKMVFNAPIVAGAFTPCQEP